MTLRVRVASLAVPALLALAGCKTGDSGSAVKAEEDGGIPAGAQGLPFPQEQGQPDFCINEGRSREALQKWTKDLWAQAFAQGLASEDLIPGRDRPGFPSPGKGYPRIFSQLIPNKVANKIWDGKTMITTEDGHTSLINRFLQANEDFNIGLFTAQVVIDQKTLLRDGDDKPVILLDYRQSKLTSPNDTFDELNFFNVPVIKAIRDEIRLVCQTTENGVRRRVYLGPTFLLPDEFKTAGGKKLAKKFEIDPILWFALEFEEPAN